MIKNKNAILNISFFLLVGCKVLVPLPFKTAGYNNSPNNYRYIDFPNEDKKHAADYYRDQFVEGGIRVGNFDNDGYKVGKWLSGNVDLDSLGNVFAKGKIWKEEYFKKGLRDSIFREYDSNGKIIYETTFKMGNGLWKEFHSNGKLYFEIQTKDGYFTDTLMLHDYNDNIIGKRLYLKDSLIYSEGLPCFPYGPESVPSD